MFSCKWKEGGRGQKSLVIGKKNEFKVINIKKGGL